MTTTRDIHHLIPSTREAILDAVGELLIERPEADFSVREVAERSGLTHRTVYRYFRSRDDLLGAGAVQHGMAHAPSPGGSISEWIDGVPEHFAQVEAAFDTYHRLVVALLTVRYPHGDEPVARRDRPLWDLFRREHPHLAADEAFRAFASLRHTLSSTSYVICRLKFGLGPSAATESLQNAGRALAARASELDRQAERQGGTQ